MLSGGSDLPSCLNDSYSSVTPAYDSSGVGWSFWHLCHKGWVSKGIRKQDVNPDSKWVPTTIYII